MDFIVEERATRIKSTLSPFFRACASRVRASLWKIRADTRSDRIVSRSNRWHLRPSTIINRTEIRIYCVHGVTMIVVETRGDCDLSLSFLSTKLYGIDTTAPVLYLRNIPFPVILQITDAISGTVFPPENVNSALFIKQSAN